MTLTPDEAQQLAALLEKLGNRAADSLADTSMYVQSKATRSER